jgi:hypothetical protein
MKKKIKKGCSRVKGGAQKYICYLCQQQNVQWLLGVGVGVIVVCECVTTHVNACVLVNRGMCGVLQIQCQWYNNTMHDIHTTWHDIHWNISLSSHHAYTSTHADIYILLCMEYGYCRLPVEITSDFYPHYQHDTSLNVSSPIYGRLLCSGAV